MFIVICSEMSIVYFYVCYDFDTFFLLSLITLFVLQLDNIEWKVLRWVGTMLWFLWYHSNVTNLMLVNLLVYWNRLSPNWLFMRFSFKFGMHFFCLHSFVNPHNEWSQLWESNQIYINNTCNMKSGFSSEQSRIFHRIETNEMEWQLFLINVFFLSFSFHNLFTVVSLLYAHLLVVLRLIHFLHFSQYIYVFALEEG